MINTKQIIRDIHKDIDTAIDNTFLRHTGQECPIPFRQILSYVHLAMDSIDQNILLEHLGPDTTHTYNFRVQWQSDGNITLIDDRKVLYVSSPDGSIRKWKGSYLRYNGATFSFIRLFRQTHECLVDAIESTVEEFKGLKIPAGEHIEMQFEQCVFYKES